MEGSWPVKKISFLSHWEIFLGLLGETLKFRFLPLRAPPLPWEFWLFWGLKPGGGSSFNLPFKNFPKFLGLVGVSLVSPFLWPFGAQFLTDFWLGFGGFLKALNFPLF